MFHVCPGPESRRERELILDFAFIGNRNRNDFNKSQEWEAVIPGNGREREFPLTPAWQLVCEIRHQEFSSILLKSWSILPNIYPESLCAASFLHPALTKGCWKSQLAATTWVLNDQNVLQHSREKSNTGGESSDNISIMLSNPKSRTKEKKKPSPKRKVASLGKLLVKLLFNHYLRELLPISSGDNTFPSSSHSLIPRPMSIKDNIFPNQFCSSHFLLAERHQHSDQRSGWFDWIQKLSSDPVAVAGEQERAVAGGRRRRLKVEHVGKLDWLHSRLLHCCRETVLGTGNYTAMLEITLDTGNSSDNADCGTVVTFTDCGRNILWSYSLH